MATYRAFYRGLWVVLDSYQDDQGRERFPWEGRVYRSLSGVATAIARSAGRKSRVTDGRRFFGLDCEEECACGLTYDAFQPGLSFADGVEMLWEGERRPMPNGTEMYRPIRTRAVQSMLREAKRAQWDEHVSMCETYGGGHE